MYFNNGAMCISSRGCPGNTGCLPAALTKLPPSAPEQGSRFPGRGSRPLSPPSPPLFTLGVNPALWVPCRALGTGACPSEGSALAPAMLRDKQSPHLGGSGHPQGFFWLLGVDLGWSRLHVTGPRWVPLSLVLGQSTVTGCCLVSSWGSRQARGRASAAPPQLWKGLCTCPLASRCLRHPRRMA